VDGKGQSISGAGLGNNGKVLAYDNNETYGYALADNSEAYRQNVELREDERIFHYGGKPVYNMDLDHAYRHAFFVRKTVKSPAYAVVCDDVAKDAAAHEYCWQMLSWPDLKINLADPKVAVISPMDSKESNSAKMFVFLDADSPLSVRQEDYTVTPDDHRKPAAYPRLRAYAKAVNPYFAAVLIPTDGSINAPKVVFDKKHQETVISIAWPKRIDKITWKRAGRSRPQIVIVDK
jgi:hypothetical protein